jgi:predicted Zn-dependent peptidase
MVILVVGDVDPQKVFEEVDAGIKPTKPQAEIKRIFPSEPDKLNTDYAEQALALSMPQFQMGFKDTQLRTRGQACLINEVSIKLLLEMIMGKSSELYNKLYGEGIINSSFDFDYTGEENYAFSLFGGESKDPVMARDKIAEEISKIINKGLSKDSFERIKRAMKGRLIRQLNSIERISHQFISVYFKDINIFDYIDIYDKITFESINEVLKQHFNIDNLALSVIKPVK